MTDTPKHPGGRPTDYTQSIADAILERLADGESLRSICSDEEMPARTTVRRWLAAHDEFRRQYTLSREEQADTLFDEILGIADDGSNDWMEVHRGEDVKWVENGEALGRSRLRIDARKWLAGKLAPKKYGEKQTLEHTGKDGGPIEESVTFKTVYEAKNVADTNNEG